MVIGADRAFKMTIRIPGGFNKIAIDTPLPPARKGRSKHLFAAAVRRESYSLVLALVAESAYVLPLFTLTRYYVTHKSLVFEPRDDDILRLWAMAWR
jgi:hypothetical protein